MIERNLVFIGVDIHVSIATMVLTLLCINALMVLILLQCNAMVVMGDDDRGSKSCHNFRCLEKQRPQ